MRKLYVGGPLDRIELLRNARVIWQGIFVEKHWHLANVLLVKGWREKLTLSGLMTIIGDFVSNRVPVP